MTSVSAQWTFNFIENDAVVARYTQQAEVAGVNGGINLGAYSDLRVGAYIARKTANIAIGDPGFPEARGSETAADLTWRLDSQDTLVIPARGVRAEVRLLHVFEAPDLVVGDQTLPYDVTRTQLSGTANEFWSIGPPTGCSCMEASARPSTPRRCLRTNSRSARRSGSERTTSANSAAPTITSPPAATCGRLAGCRTSSGDRCSSAAGSKTVTPSMRGATPDGGATAVSAW